MKLTLAKQSVIAAGFLVTAAAVIFLKNSPAPIKGGKTPEVERPQRSANSRNPRPSVRSASTSETNPDSPAFLPSFEALASSNPKMALADLAKIEDPDLLLLALAAVAAGWAQVDPQAAAQWVAGLPSEDQRREAGAGVISAWAASAPADCLAWVAQNPAGDLREESLVKLADAWGSTDPQAALTGYLALAGGSDSGLRSIVSRWVIDDPSVAVENVSALGISSKRDELLQTALVSLSSQDPELAWKFSERMADRKSIEQVRSMALKTMAATRPLEAIKLAEAVGNSEVLLVGIARGWASTDDSAAEQWIASLADPELAARLREATSE